MSARSGAVTSARSGAVASGSSGAVASRRSDACGCGCMGGGSWGI